MAVRFLKPSKACDKVARKKSWLWDRVKNDPDFPKPIYLSPGAPVFIEEELEAWQARQIEASRKAAA